ncbi:MAG: bifunctional 3-deoxy-7-phosphoheptulonate synthase/chorismate mutase type II [Bacteroidales bacterium]|nr:bifunctional 3-deoxy-7-phosphoheptulonate synthase/chorismate mutase type II [Bacteroidales bacterium]
MNSALNILPLNKWLNISKYPFVISGPCSAETEEQLLTTAKNIAKIPNVKIFRAGIWKPRTRPEFFEGVGIKGLKWLKNVKKETGLLIAVEVANPHHIEEALHYDIDILWIGARTVVNPFSIQELAKVLNGVDIPVMIKNPVNPDLELWIGALERINNAGIRKLVAIHRGFYFFKKSNYRNIPMWEIPIELKRLFPDLPILCDPSHICGNTELLQSVSQKALDLEMDGLMIESHINPETALTDGEQQITPKKLQELIAGLTVRKEKGNIDFENKLEKLRIEIDKLDEELIDTMSRRMKIVEKIGEFKRDNNITILQIKRWNNILQERLNNGINLGLNKEFLLKLFELIHKQSIQKQTDILNKKNR